MKCVRCGDCCREGGQCLLREWIDLSLEFEGTCELLADDNLCNVLRGQEGEPWWDDLIPEECSKIRN